MSGRPLLGAAGSCWKHPGSAWNSRELMYEHPGANGSWWVSGSCWELPGVAEGISGAAESTGELRGAVGSYWKLESKHWWPR